MNSNSTPANVGSNDGLGVIPHEARKMAERLELIASRRETISTHSLATIAEFLRSAADAIDKDAQDWRSVPSLCSEIVSLRTALADILNQVRKCSPVDDHGHQFVMNMAYLEGIRAMDKDYAEAEADAQRARDKCLGAHGYDISRLGPT